MRLVFLFYYVWGFFIYLVFFFKNLIEYLYIKYNKTHIIFKRDFNDISYFEKLFLVFFYRKNIFKNSIANIFTNENLFNFRKNKFPLIFFFHLYFDKFNYKVEDLNLKFFVKIFKFFKKSKKFYFFNVKVNSLFRQEKNLVSYLIFQKLLFKRYYNLCSSLYFDNKDNYNLIKLNFVFYIFLIRAKKKYVLYDLSKYSDWYEYSFKRVKNNNKIIFNSKRNKTPKEKLIIKNKISHKAEKVKLLTKIYKKYNNFYKNLFFKIGYFFKNIFILNFKFKNFKLVLNTNWFKELKLFYPIRYNESSISKHINLNNSRQYVFFYIRKNRIFNKGRYSRNRQLYRTGVYWCLWLNIILVYGLYFLFYRFTFNFGYFWWGILIFAYSTIFSRVIKYNYHNLYFIFFRVKKLVKMVWFYFLWFFKYF